MAHTHTLIFGTRVGNNTPVYTHTTLLFGALPSSHHEGGISNHIIRFKWVGQSAKQIQTLIPTLQRVQRKTSNADIIQFNPLITIPTGCRKHMRASVSVGVRARWSHCRTQFLRMRLAVSDDVIASIACDSLTKKAPSVSFSLSLHPVWIAVALFKFVQRSLASTNPSYKTC